ncbi:MAG TPA: putative transporter small subunit [Candidatus Agrococcus pullicola]|uniref:Transporter small subunit n=1 Tax=Candidatus Agrococcus pullicola TaxID=2838429 RepID=A0A9D1YVS6_9MICO|nr:putative transporter small subunit [Candidatus Agrococcus pullicola]
METIALTAYVLMWPVLVAGVIGVIARGFFRDWRQSRKDGKPLI